PGIGDGTEQTELLAGARYHAGRRPAERDERGDLFAPQPVPVGQRAVADAEGEQPVAGTDLDGHAVDRVTGTGGGRVQGQVEVGTRGQRRDRGDEGDREL